ncbi:MAG TPA: hypothetical protein VMH35_09140 [Streptosporangiaceae bacterium]|nr:hypothetical protein [Streptosporangiaceae bacterium]
MSNVSWDPSEDIETPTDDAVEQHEPLAGQDEPADPQAFELPGEANEADVAEQNQAVEDDDDESYR